MRFVGKDIGSRINCLYNQLGRRRGICCKLYLVNFLKTPYTTAPERVRVVFRCRRFTRTMHPLEYENIKINTVDWHPGYPCYVISYDNCIEHTPKTSILVKIGDNVVIEQLKYILSFSF